MNYKTVFDGFLTGGCTGNILEVLEGFGTN